ncbi:MAG TPA: carboxylating nicotinate-nucleotide diphosphorylase [Cyclobacteriaceae bacterium]|nr:carboxylating nicotinate-nucleotide diphosphorylase [Cyclobacteriaceae bacterium]
MRPPYVTPEALRDLITIALSEDIGSGDITTEATVPADANARGRMVAKDAGVLAGIEVAVAVFHQTNQELDIQVHMPDGTTVKSGDVVMEVSGHARSLLSAERVALNVVQRMSGIATYTHQLCLQLAGTGVQLLDTRKTTPGFRSLEKWAVAIGGGVNHRYNLSEMILLKDNHIDMAGGIGAAIRKVRQLHHDKRIEVETRTMKEVQEVLEAGGVDIILLDNMSVADLTMAVKLIGGRCKTEASGGISPESLSAVAATGVDYVSMGALTHSYKSLDLNFKVMAWE